MGMFRFAFVRMIHASCLVASSSWARTFVKERSSTWRFVRNTCSGDSLCFFTSILSWIGFLHVRIAGLGRRASTDMEGGASDRVGCEGSLPKRVGFRFIEEGALVKVCERRA